MKKTIFLLACLTILGASVVSAQTTPAAEKQKTIQTKNSGPKKETKEVRQSKSTAKPTKSTAATTKKTTPAKEVKKDKK